MLRTIIRWLDNWFKQKKTHYLFPILTLAIGWWLSMLTNRIVGAIFFCITIYLLLVIFIPWDKIKISGKVILTTYLVPAIICLVIVVPMWNNIVSIFPSQYKDLIRTSTATVDITVQSEQDKSRTVLGEGGGYLAFCKGSNALLVNIQSNYDVTQSGESEFVYSGVFNMDVSSETTKETVKYLEQTEYIQIRYSDMPDNTQVLNGKAIVTINNSVRFEFDVPPQPMNSNLTSSNFIIIPNVKQYLCSIMK